MKLIPIGIVTVVLFLAMTAVMYFVVGKIKPMEADLIQTKKNLSSRIDDLIVTENKLFDAQEKSEQLQNKLDAAEAKIMEMEIHLKQLRKQQ